MPKLTDTIYGMYDFGYRLRDVETKRIWDNEIHNLIKVYKTMLFDDIIQQLTPDCFAAFFYALD